MPIVSTKAAASVFGYGLLKSPTSSLGAFSWMMGGDTSNTPTYSNQFIKVNWDTSTFSVSTQARAVNALSIPNTTASWAGIKGFTYASTSSAVFNFSTETNSLVSVSGYSAGSSTGSGYHDSSNYHWVSGGGSYPGITDRARIAQSTMTLSSQGNTYQHYGGAGFANSGGNGYDTCGYDYSNIATTWQFSLSTGTGGATSNAINPRYVPSGTFNHGDAGYLGGGQNGTSSTFYYAIEKRTFGSNTVSSVGANMTAPCQTAGYVQRNGRGFYIVGGGQTSLPRSTRIDYFNFSTATISTNVSALTNAVTYVEYYTNQPAY
jgi:hypothetical protein